MKAFGRVLLIFGNLLLLSFRADAHDPSMAHHEWFNAGNDCCRAAAARRSVEVMLRQWRCVQNPFQGC